MIIPAKYYAGPRGVQLVFVEKATRQSKTKLVSFRIENTPIESTVNVRYFSEVDL